MRRDELMNSDPLSQVVLGLVGAAILMLLASTVYLAVFSHAA